MNIIDLHCDALYKLYEEPLESFEISSKLDVTLEQLKAGSYKLQVFAIYIDSEQQQTIDTMLQMVDIFYRKVLQCPELLWIRSKEDLYRCLGTSKIGVMLSLEGVACLEGKLYMSSIIEQLGIRAAGLTWNDENWAAEGVLAGTGNGLSPLGKQFLTLASAHNMIIDLSHLSVQSFTDVLDHYKGPVWASHSNCYTICPHPRNIDDNQIKAIIARQGLIGLTYVPQFISEDSAVYAHHLFAHIDHLLALGAEHCIALGSDFDGITNHVLDLTCPNDVSSFVDQLEQRYGTTLVQNLTHHNAIQFLERHLL